MKCLQCGSDRIAADVRVIDRGDGNVTRDFSLQTYENPQAFLFKGAESYSVSANVCANCGFIMLSVPKDVAAQIYGKKRRERYD